MNKYGGKMELNFTGENRDFLTKDFPVPLYSIQVSNVVIQRTNPKNRGEKQATELKSLQTQKARDVLWFSIYH
jgi:hypothetical protein